MDRKSRLLQTLLRLTQDLKKSNPLLLLALGLVPLCLVIWRLEEKSTQLEILTKKIEALEERALSYENSKATRAIIWEAVKQSNPNYLSQVIESLPLLTAEQSRVQALARQYPSNLALQERLSFLQGDKNRIRFIQEAQRAGPFFQETEHKMQNTVQMNEDDLKKFLTLIEEEDSKDRPLLFIKEFELKRLKEKADEIVYNVQAELIKRAP
jgi:hypothetical protein